MPNERIEWTRCWREDADLDKKRFLLIGDSMIDGSKGNIYKALPDDIATTAVITSKGVDSEFFTKEIELFCMQENFDYEVVYFNNGIHAHDQSPEEYDQNYRRALKTLMSKIPKAKWILGLCTPVTPHLSSGELYEAPVTLDLAKGFDPVCTRILMYNQKVEKIAKDFGVEIFDAYSLLADKPELKVDTCHLNEVGRDLFGKAIAKKMMEVYKDE